MEFRKVLTLRGPNLWTNFPVLEVWVDLGVLKDSPSDSIPGFNDRLMSWLPSLIEHRCSIGERGGFFERLRRGTWPAHILEHITLELQNIAGTEVKYGKTREIDEDAGLYRMIIEYEDETLGKACLETALRLQLAAVYDTPFDLAGELGKLKALAQSICLGPSTRAIVDAAYERRIPYRRLDEHSLVQLGYGAKQRRIRAAETDATSAIAESIAQDKELTKRLLRSVGAPVPAGRVVTSAEDAWTAAQEIAAPVVVKPRDGNHGRGVAINLTDCAAVMAAYDAARAEEPEVMVEQYAPGDDYRLLVIGGKLVAAARRDPAHVVGDGQRTIDQLVEIVNQDPRRGDDHALPLSKICIDQVALGVLTEQGYTPASVPPAGEKVLIRRNGNLSTGGTAVDVTDDVHPDVAAQAVLAARAIGLDVAGVDILARDIGQPLESQGGAIVEVNAGPGLRMHASPSYGKPRPVGEAIIDQLFPRGDNGRIPIVAVTGTNGKTTTTRLVSHFYRTAGYYVGMTCTDGIFVDQRRIDTGDCSGPASAQAVLMNPHVEVAVLETARGGILRAGLGFDRCDVAIVTNIGEGDHLGIQGIDTLEQMAQVKRCIVDVVLPTGAAVLNADDPLTVDMAPHCKGSVIFFSRNAVSPVLLAHRRQGGRAVYVRNHTIVLGNGTEETPLMTLDRVPLTHNGRVFFMVENVLAATAAAWSLGLPLNVIREGLATFSCDMEKVPGRFNVLEINGATIIVDYGHNVSALQALIEAIDPFPHQRRLAVYSAAGDRRDEDMVRQGEMLGHAFDMVILYEDHYLRGRADGEIMRLFRSGLENGSRAQDVYEVRGALLAVEGALDLTKPGDVVLLQADVIDETVDFIKRYQESQLLMQRLVEPEPASAPVPAQSAVPVAGS